MLVKALARPLINNICKVPSRSTSAIIGRRTNNVSVLVREHQHIFEIRDFSNCYFCWNQTIPSPPKRRLNIFN